MSTEEATPAVSDSTLREQLLRSRLAGRRARRRDTFARADRTAPLALSHGQQQMWFLGRLEPDSTEYLVPLVLRLRGAVDTAALGRAFQSIVARHEILRTRYAFVGGSPVQVVDAPGTLALPLPVVPVTDVPADRREQRAEEMLREQLATGFDLAADWPVRATLLRLADDDHILALVFHHIACDAWSTRVFGAELSSLYTAFTEGRDAQMPPLALQYADYAAWQRAELAGSGAAAHLAYWRDRLAGVEAIELPTDRPRPAVRDHAGADLDFDLPDGLADRVRETALAHDTTPFTVLLTAYQALIARYTGKRDVPVGTVVSGRTRPELQQLIGYGINTLVMRARWDENATFAGVLDAGRQDVLDAFDHQQVPFAQLVDELQPERDRSRTPLYQVAFTLHEWRLDSFTLPGLRVEPFGDSDGIAKCDLTLQVQELPDGSFKARMQYATALFDRSTVRRVAGNFVRLLDQALSTPDAPLAALDVLGDAERAIVTGALDGARTAEPVTALAHELFEARVAETPDAVAVVAGDVSLTYAEVNERANRLAHVLRGAGIGPEDLVGVHLERGPELIPTLLGVLKSGAGYLPLDPANPVDRLGYVIEDAGAATVVTDTRLLPTLSTVHTGSVVALDDEETVAALAQAPADDPVRVSHPDNVIYTIYTSGSTGRPKGVVLSHTQVVRLMSTAQEHYGFDASDAWSMAHSYAFDVSVFEMWGALAHGGRLVVVPHAVTRAPEEFLDLLVRERVTVLSQTPTAFRSLVAFAAARDPRVRELLLRAVIFAGEKLEETELGPWTDLLGLDAPVLVNMYGITETTVHTTYHQVEEQDVDGLASHRVGYPLSDLSVYLLDASGALAPIGVPGEIHVAGPGVARGYLGRPDLTAERFVPNPFGPAGSRMYRSGDLARRREDGSLEVLGRIDDQVKIRGYRIELGEISARLSAHASVAQAVVVVREDTPGDKRLVAYVVPAEAGAEPPIAEIRAELARELPDYMVPAAFVAVDAIPLTTNGKLDKRALPAPESGLHLRAAGEFTAPRTPDEESVAAVWRSVLGVERVGVHDSFFELGGDSIRAVALVGELREAGYEVAVRDVFDRRTVARLTELATGRPAGEAVAERRVAPFELIGDADRALLPAGAVDAYPLGQNQLGMVIEMLMDDGRNHYHNVSTFRIRDERPFSLDALAEAGRIVTARHEVLRTSLDLTTYSRPLQIVHEHAELPISASDLTGLAPDEVTAALRAFTVAERARLFDLATPSLMRFHAHTADDGGWWISVTECHPILEGWSHHSLLMELLRTYQAVRDGRAPEPVELPSLRFADFIAGELAALDDASDRTYWSELVENHAKFTLPETWGDPEAAHVTFQTGISWQDLEPGLRALAAAADASLKSVMIAAHLKVLGQLTHEQAFHTGLVCDARPEETGADRVLGMYLNTLPFPHTKGARTWRELVRAAFAAEVELWGHRRYPLPAVQRDWGGTGRLMDVYFNYQDFRQIDTDLVDELAGIDDSPTEFPLSVSSRAGHIILTADVRAVTPAHAERLAAAYRSVLEAMAADADGDAVATHLLDDERTALLTAAQGPAAVPTRRTALDAITATAARLPEAVAARDARTSLDYADLMARSEALARRLRAAGAGPESVVGVLLDRTVDLPVALLAAWRAGAAYVPMDPSWPADRIAAVVADAGCPAVVTEDAYAGLFTGFDGRIVLVPRQATSAGAPVGEDAGAVDDSPLPGADPDHLAYVIYTSGSTGRPKGVQITHRSLAGYLDFAVADYLGGAPGDTALFSSVAFDLVVPTLYAPLLTGGALNLFGADRDLSELGDWLAAHGPFGFLKLTPGHLEMLGRQFTDGRAHGLAPVLVVGGEALLSRTAEHWVDLVGGGRVVNEYGPTEITVGNCVHTVTGPQPTEIVPVGRPLPGTAMYVLDEQLQLVPAGGTGELYIGGPGLARGYAQAPAQTASAFLPDPYGPPGTRLYRTGDLARVLADGTVDFRGRADGQVKLRGYRVEPGEIEAALGAHPAVREARVTVHESAAGKQLVAYVVPDGALPAHAELEAHLAGLLPPYMLPAAYLALEAIPLTANGKLDARALPAPDTAALATDSYVAPRTPAEERMAAVWATHLGLERVGVLDSFFQLGGDSIRAVSLVGALRQAGFEAGVRDVFEKATVAALCEAMTGRPAPAAAPAAVAPFALIGDADRALLPEGLADAYPLSQNQTGMLVETLASDGRNNYHDLTSFLVRDDAPFDGAALERAVAIVGARHDILRTSVDLTGYSVPLQLVHAEVAIPLGVADVSHLSEAELRTELAEFVARERAALFDLESSAPLLRIFVHVQSDEAWRLTFTKSHAMLEGWSYHTLLNELVDVYKALRSGAEPAPYEAPTLRFADTVAAELAALEDPADRAHWQGIVDTHAPFTLPADWHGDRDAPARTVGAGFSFRDLEPALRTLAARAGVPLKAVLHAAHLKVMSQLTGEDRFFTGLVGHNRPEVPGAERLLGMYLNTMPHAHDRSARTWGELVRQAFDGEVAAWPHRNFPLPAIQAGGRRLIDVYFVYLDFHLVGDDQVVDEGNGINSSSTEFGLGVTTIGGFLSLRTSSHVLSERHAERISGMYRAVLEAMAAEGADGDPRAVRLPAGEYDLVVRGADTEESEPVTGLAHELFEARVAKTPDAVAVVAGDVSLTYAEVNERANRLAHVLRGAGVGPEDLVGVHLERGAELIPTLLGVLKSGAGYLPLDPANPVDRLGFVIEDAGARVVITTSALLPALSAVHAGDVVALDDAETVAALAQAPADDPVRVSHPDNVIYTIYTSGSTGRPKGVVLSHANVVRLLETAQEHYAFDESDVWSMAHSYAFDVSVFEMWGALAHGGRLVVVPHAVTRAPEEFLDLLVRERVTVLSQTPTAFRSLVAFAAADDPRLRDLALRAVVFAGEKLEVTELGPWTDLLGLDAPVLVNMYGITETTVHTTYHRVDAEDLARPAASRVGRPLADLTVLLLDRDGHLVPVGIPGEMYVAGPGVARGYLGRPDLTAERFVPNPFGPAGSRMYRSGDLARRREDGSLEVLGRIDDQVKIRGYRIELGEIAAALAAEPSVAQAVVVVREDTPGDKRLVAYVVPAEGGLAAPRVLRENLGRALPEYMVPAVFTTLDAIPLTVNGKLDKRALPAPDATASDTASYVAPRTPVEQQLSLIWADALGRDTVGVEDAFFDLGGDSIRAVALVGAMRAAGLDVTVRDVFERRTVAAVAELVSGRAAPAEAFRAVEPFAMIGADDRALLPATVVDAYPLTQVQTGMLVEMTAGAEAAYHSTASYKVRDERPFDANALRAAVATVIARHEVLRTSFDLSTASRPLQLVHAAAEAPVTVHDLGALDAAGVDAALRAHQAAERAALLDPASAPQLRVAAHVAGDGWWLGLTQSHMITEGWSQHAMLMELLACYRAYAEGREPDAHHAPEVRFADSVAAELAALDSPEDREHWQDVVRRHTPFPLPADWADRTGAAEDFAVTVPLTDLEAPLRAFAARAGVSVKSVLLAAHLKVLGQLTDEPAFHTGLICDTRTEVLGADRVYGMYVNTLPFPHQRSARTWRELVRQVFEREVALWPHRRFPFPEIQRTAGTAGRLVDVIFNYQDFHNLDGEQLDLAAGLGSGTTEFALEVATSGGGLTLKTSTKVLARDAADRLAAMYRAVLEAMATEGPDGDARAARLTAEDGRLLDTWTDTARTPTWLGIEQALERFAVVQPDRIALSDDTTQLTYAAVNAEANRLARHLRDLGVGPDTVVGISADRSTRTVLAVLAVLKAGGAYLPLDPAHPASRLAFMAADADVKVLITQSSYGERLAGIDAAVVLLDEPAAWAGQDAADLAHTAHPDDLAYVIYTSGSTGRPKGVHVHRHGMANHLLAKVEDLELTGADSIVQNASMAFDISVWQMLAAFAVGGRVRVADADTALDPLSLFPRTADEEITVLEVVPSLLRAALDAMDAGALDVALPHLRWMVVTGEALPPDLCRRWFERFPHVPMVNAYGPTECSDDITHALIRAGDPIGDTRVTIGRPVRNFRLYVLDEHLAPVPVGVPGELYAGGVGVARGYGGRPGLTAERFVPDPYGPAGSRLYRTGDVVAWNRSGAVEFLGRVDHQVKIRGQRIELGEIEAVLVDRPEIADAAAIVREDTPGVPLLVAYLVPAEDSDLDVAVLRAALAEELPPAMVPGAYVTLDALPLTPNGKVDRRGLPAPEADPSADATYVEPVTDAERTVAEVWEQALGVHRIGARDGFFDRGGDSIRAVTVVGALRGRGYDVSVRDVFEHRTVAALAELAGGRDRLTEQTAAVAPFALIGDADRALLPAGAVDAYPLGQVQLGMVAELLSGNGRNSYHTVASKRIRDDRPFDADALRAAVAAVAARHDVLRTSVHITGYSVPMQVVHADVDVPVRVQDLRGADLADGERELLAFVAAERADLFDFRTAPLLRVAVHLESDDAWWLTLTQSHAIVEGWSQHTLEMELVNAYRELRDFGETAPYQAPPVRFADFVAGELESLDSAADRAYWERVVKDHARLAPPVAWAGDPAATAEPYSVDVPLAAIADALKQRAAEADVPLKTLLLTAHLEVMGKLTDATAFHTGVVFHARPEAVGADRVIGMHLNTLPFPHTKGAATWREAIGAVYRRETESWAHRRYPLPAVQRAFGGRQRLLDVHFNYIDFHQTDTALVDTSTGISEAPTEFGLSVHAHGDRKIGIHSDTGLITRDDAARLAALYREALESMASGLDTPLPVEEPESESGPLAHELFEARVAETPDAVAVVAGDVSLTYAEVNERANRLAHVLRGAGVGPEDLVGVHLERGAELIPTLLGVLKSGAGYLPLDPANPVDRLGFVIEDAGARVVITTSALLPALSAVHAGDVVVLDAQDTVAALGRAAAGDPVRVGHPDNVIYTIYTSGSTGRPKGVVLSHANVVRLLETAQEHYAFDESDVWSMAHSYAFDVSVFEMWGALAHGGRLVVVPHAVTRAPDEFLDLLVEEEVSVLSQTPTAFRALVTAAAAGDRRVKQLGLRAVVFAGEKLEIAELRPWTEKLGLGRTSLVNMYGITETTVHTTYHRLTKRDFAPGAGNPVGRPLSDLTVHLLDQDGREVPDGTEGEMYVAGPGVARGYLGRPDLTAERFVPNPFGPAGSRMYRSGDLARRREDGSLDFVGRIDDQVKIRGYRVELGEIAARLSAHESVAQAVVVVREDTPGDKRLVGYLVAAAKDLPDTAALRSELARDLPDYMVPAAFVAVDAIPLTTNGKLDKRALPSPEDGGRLRSATEYVAPRTPLEEAVAAVYRTVLGAEHAGVHDSFFDLGGDSIRAVLVVGTLRDAGHELSVRELMEHPVLADLAELLAARSTGAASVAALPPVAPYALLTEADRALLPAGVVDAYPLTQNQLGMQIEMLSAADRPDYHLVTSLRVRDGRAFDAAAFQSAVDELVARHEVLRTGVDLDTYSVPLQLVHATAELAVRVVDLSGLDEEGAATAIEAYVDERSRSALDPATAPLLDLTVHLCGDGSRQLTAVNSHVILDGWSLGVLLTELLALYDGAQAGRPPAHDAPAVRFADTVAAEVRALASETDRAYWQGVITGHERFTLPAGWGESDPDAPQDMYLLDVGYADLRAGLERLAADAQAPLKSVLFAAHLKALSLLTPEPAFLTGLTAHVRPEAAGADRVAGMYLNIQPVGHTGDARTWRELVERTFAAELAAVPHRHFPMPAIQREFGDGARLIETYFSYQDFTSVAADQERTGTGVDADASTGASSNEFGFSVGTAPGRLQLRCAPRAVSRANGERIAALYRQVLVEMAGGADGDARSGCLPPAETGRVAGWENAPAGAVADRPVHEAFAAQAARTPDAVAVTGDGFTYSYAELEARANQVAHRLLAHGIGAEAPVGVLLDRGPDLHAALLGVWKAGAAYVPLDPGFPAARVEAMLSDAGATLALTTNAYADRFASGVTVLDLAAEAADIAARPTAAPDVPGDPDRLAYVIYTSGSTGRPKGVAVTHRGLANHLGWAV
ncbi:amino acid adenylation domain-containing protein, partial [Streptomyces sp. NPDC006172]|uniref:amino acid adenylation domain-containing protein n=1 Tax=Streptomyces sp. NPDC006172 TaxID=3154470 RepID=UPI0033C198EA